MAEGGYRVLFLNIWGRELRGILGIVLYLLPLFKGVDVQHYALGASANANHVRNGGIVGREEFWPTARSWGSG